MLLVTAAEMRALDRRTIDDIGVPGVVLMESAGRGVVDVMAATMPLPFLRVMVFCGPGNNGGDGFVIARHLANRGAHPTVALVGDRGKISGDARIHFDACEKSAVPIVDAAAADLRDGDAVVDAIFGTGLSRPVDAGAARDAIEKINRHRALVFAVDVPSGLDADKGVIGPCVRADHTVTFAFAKLGLVGENAIGVVGRLHVADIGIPPFIAAGVQSRLLDAALLDVLRHRDPAGHKGTHGHVLVVAGSPGKTGAALLCGTAALRAGAGLCTVAMPPDAADAVEGRVPELMLERYGDLQPLLDGKKAIAVGPGVPRSDDMRAHIVTLANSDKPLVLDADALNHVARDPSLLAKRSAPTVMTPHPGEAARLLNVSVAEVQNDRVAAARAIAGRFGAVAVVKGARTVIASPDGKLAVNPTGNPGMGTGGTGDVLTGCVASALARVADPFVAACAAVYLHGAAGDWAARQRSETGLIASDVIDALPHVLAPR
jgi:ADP-dependent NAD(P)H-hydrate dehydratase / NAD(P)H-hydrate epimerase